MCHVSHVAYPLSPFTTHQRQQLKPHTYPSPANSFQLLIELLFKLNSRQTYNPSGLDGRISFDINYFFLQGVRLNMRVC